MNTPLNTLIGLWKGEGVAEYPTIDRIRYREELEFNPIEGREVLHYIQRTWRIETDAPSHWEAGFLRIRDGELELASAQIGGRVEVMSGSLTHQPDGIRLKFQSTEIGNDERIVSTTRTFEADSGRLRYSMSMHTHATKALILHLSAVLNKI